MQVPVFLYQRDVSEIWMFAMIRMLSVSPAYVSVDLVIGRTTTRAVSRRSSSHSSSSCCSCSSL